VNLEQLEHLSQKLVQARPKLDEMKLTVDINRRNAQFDLLCLGEMNLRRRVQNGLIDV
jgi:hypothetical protein